MNAATQALMLSETSGILENFFYNIVKFEVVKQNRSLRLPQGVNIGVNIHTYSIATIHYVLQYNNSHDLCIQEGHFR